MKRLSRDDAYYLGLLLMYAVFMTPAIIWGMPWIRREIPTLDPIKAWGLGLARRPPTSRGEFA